MKQQDIYKKLIKIGESGDYWEKSGDKDRHEKMISIILEMVKSVPHKRILDVGCANGIITKRLATFADEVVAIDISEDAIKRARKLNGTRNIAYRVSTFADFSDEKGFDVIVCSEVL